MGKMSPVTVQSVDPALAGRIIEIADRDGPRAAYAALSQRLTSLQSEGGQIPPNLATLQKRLASECCALSQGR